MEETLTVTRLGVRGRLKRTLASTNPCKSMTETVRRVARNVKRWFHGERASSSGPVGRFTLAGRGGAKPRASSGECAGP
jgi:hypothetical protein